MYDVPARSASYGALRTGIGAAFVVGLYEKVVKLPSDHGANAAFRTAQLGAVLPILDVLTQDLVRPGGSNAKLHRRRAVKSSPSRLLGRDTPWLDGVRIPLHFLMKISVSP